MLGSLILPGYEHDRDFPAFSRRTDDASEADEIAYTEVVEYLRVGLLMVLEDLRHAASTPHSLH